VTDHGGYPDHADRAYRHTRSELPCVAADWAGGSERFTAVVLLVFALALVAVALSWLV
jgi:hypothetical protein